MSKPSKKKIRELNDAMREDLASAAENGQVSMTHGVRALEPTDQLRMLKLVKGFDGFNKDNDPHREHDFGKVTLAQIDYFWKIDYYDKELAHASEDPADPEKTTRVLTIMRADEY